MTIYVGSSSTSIYKGSSLVSNTYVGSQAVGKVKNAFSPLKVKLQNNQPATIFVNGDSTAYSNYGPYFLWAAQLGNLYNSTVTVYLWREYADGTKDYDTGTVVRTGSGPNIKMYLAAFPGKVAGTMFEGTRKPTAIDAIPTPDVCIMHQGHNMSTFPKIAGQPVGSLHYYSAGIGKWLGPLGMQEVQWPNVPQVVTTQNPWKDQSDGGHCYNTIKLLAQVQSGVTIVDSYAKFVARGYLTTDWRSGDNIHPSDSQTNSAGAQLVADSLMETFNSAATTSFTLAPWPLNSATSLIDNGDFSNWTGSLPVGWTTNGAGLTVVKDVTNVYGGAAYSCSISPATTTQGQLSYLQKYLSTTEYNRIVGKTLTVAALVKSTNNVNNPGVYFSVYNNLGNLRDYVTFGLLDADSGWMWHIMTGIQVTTDSAQAWRYLRLVPAQTTSNPTTNNPMYVQRVLVFEGTVPAGIIA